MSTSRQRLLLLAKWALCLAVFGFVGKYVLANWQAVADVKPPVPGWLLLGSLIALTSPLLSGWSCQRLVAAHGYKVSYQRALGLCYVPILGKYLPGKIWSLLAAVHLYAREGIPKKVATTCITLYMALGLASAAMVTLLMALVGGGPPGRIWPCAAMIALLAAGLLPPIRYGVANAVLALLGQTRIQTAVSLPRLLQVLAALILGKSVYGVGFFFFVQGFLDVPLSDLSGLIALFTFAQIAGVVALFAPAGIGVRDGVLLLGLQPIVGPGPAIVITGACRIWQTALELIMAGWGWLALSGRMERKRPPQHCRDERNESEDPALGILRTTPLQKVGCDRSPLPLGEG